MPPLPRAAAVAAICSCCACATAAGAEVPSRVVALSGEQAPGAADTFRTFANPVISSDGRVAFQANLSGPVTNFVPHGVWAGSRGDLKALALAGREAPDTGGARFRSPGWPITLTRSGEVLFYGSLLEGGGVTFDNDYGIWAGAPGGVRLVSRRGSPAAGLPGGVNYNLFFANPHPSGAMGFSASLSGPGVDGTNDTAVWLGRIGPTPSLQLLARGGDAAPGMQAGSRFTGLGTPLVSESGRIVLPANVVTPASGTQPLQGFWAGTPDALRVVALSGDAAPGADGRRFSFMSVPRLNDAGHVAFMGFLSTESPEEQLNNVGIWAGPAAVGGAVNAVAMEGRQAPGFASGVVFRGSAPGDDITYDAFRNPTLGGGGHVAFAATVFGDATDFDHNDGVWRSGPAGGAAGDPDSLALVAREGDRPPGTPEGTRFRGVLSGDDLIPAFESPLLNDRGQIAFEALTTGPLGEFGRGIWASDPGGVLRLVAHTGEEFVVGPGDVRVVELLKLNAGGSSDEGIQSALNDAGQLTFGARFTDGSEGVFVAVVPEPATALLAAAVGALVALRRR